MEKEPLPPSYNEVFPTAPPSQQGSFAQGPSVGWNPPQMPHQQMPPQYAPQMQQPQMMQQQPIVQQPAVTQVIVINNQMRFGPHPTSMICPHCREQTVSKITYESNFINHLGALACCMVGCFWGCCLVPYCINGVKNVRHNCSRCGTFLGLYRYGNRSG